jgi:hypothetical protein
MKSTTSLQVDTHVLLKLIEQLRRRGGSQDLTETFTSAIELWLAEQAKLRPGSDPGGGRGYQWKSLFLPEGTVLRSWSYGEHNYARVEGDQIIHDGRAVSPNRFAQMFAQSTRNAWNDLYVRRPSDKQFKLACRLRDELKQPADIELPVVEPPAPSAAPDAAVAVLVAALQAVVPGTQCGQPSPARDGTPAAGWNLPERRKYRYRIEDVAFD